MKDASPKCPPDSLYNAIGHGKAPMIPAEPLEEAVIDRLVRIGVNVGDTQKIVDAALREIDDEGRKLASKIDIARHRLTRVQAEIQNLLEVLKNLGKSGLTNIRGELQELEQERETLKSEIKEMTEQESPLKRVSEAAREFIENWRDIGEILEEAEPDEKRCILHHFIQSITLTFADTKKKRAEYSLALFPEVGPSEPDGPNEKRTDPKNGDGPDVLTAYSKLRQNGEKAPRSRPSPPKLSRDKPTVTTSPTTSYAKPRLSRSLPQPFETQSNNTHPCLTATEC
jgi:archaellum component FlaC